jgi:hypothetical protein
MPKDKDHKIEPTENQCDPYLARPEQFQITRADEAATKRVPGHGQHGSNLREYKRLLKDPKRPHHSDHGQTLPPQAGD